MTLTSKYKSVETVTGAPVKKVPSTLTSRKVNPVRARRSRARLEEFSKKKVAEKDNFAGDITTSGTANSWPRTNQWRPDLPVQSFSLTGLQRMKSVKLRKKP